MLLDDAIAADLNGRLKGRLREVPQEWRLPRTLEGDRSGAAARWQARFRRDLAQRDAQPVVGPDVDHRGRSDLPGASNSGAEALGGDSRWSSSLNWSGAIMAAGGGRQFTSVSASWRLPPLDAIKLPEGAPRDRPPSDRVKSYKVSIWVGLDGHRLGSPSMPQLGTTIALHHDPQNPRNLPRLADSEYVIETYAWLQWWVREKSSRPGYTEVRFAGIAVAPGEEVTCALDIPRRGVATDGEEATFVIVNETSRQRATQLWGAERGAGVQRVSRAGEDVDGAAACFIVERPTVHAEDILYPMPRFGVIAFEDCWGRQRPPTGMDLRESRVRDLATPRLIRMFDRRGMPFRTTSLATPRWNGAARSLRVAARV
jgi:hypothetical protein